MRKLRIGVIIIGIIVIIVNLIMFDYSDFSWSANEDEYRFSLLFIIIIIGMAYSIWHDQKKQSE